MVGQQRRRLSLVGRVEQRHANPSFGLSHTTGHSPSATAWPAAAMGAGQSPCKGT